MCNVSHSYFQTYCLLLITVWSLYAKIATSSSFHSCACMPLTYQMLSIPSSSLILAGLGLLWPLKYSRNIVPVGGPIFKRTHGFCFLPLGAQPPCCEETQAATFLWRRIKGSSQESLLSYQLTAINKLFTMWVGELRSRSIGLIWATPTETTQNWGKLPTPNPAQITNSWTNSFVLFFQAYWGIIDSVPMNLTSFRFHI